MFLDDQIVNMVIERNAVCYEDWLKLLNDIINLCRERMLENLHNDMRNSNILPSAKQVCNLWDSAARTLNKKGNNFLKEGGFRDYLLSDPNVAKILISRGL